MPAYGLRHLADLLQLDVAADEDLQISGVGTLAEAESGDLVFAEHERLIEQVRATRATLVLVPPNFPEVPLKRLWRVDQPRLMFLRVAELFVELPGCDGIHPRASIHPDAELGLGVSVGACAVISKSARVGANTCIAPGVFIGEGVRIGADCRIDANAALLPGVSIGDRVIIRTNAGIGGEGFGFTWMDDHHHRIPQLGRVEIGDDVEIGCNSCVDRATLGVTQIGSGTKIDNLVQVGHNCIIGEHVILVGQVGVAGSVNIGAGAVLGGRVAVSDHLKIGAGAKVAGRSGVTKNIRAGERVAGFPAQAFRQAWKEQAAVGKLPDMVKQFKAMQKELDALKARLAQLEDGGE